MILKRIKDKWDKWSRQDWNDNMSIIEKNFNNVVDVVSNRAYNQVVESATLIWKEPVNTFSDLVNVYPKAEVGWTVTVREVVTGFDGKGVNKVYRYNGSEWIEIQQILADAINAVDHRLSSQLAQTVGIPTDKFPRRYTDIDDTERLQRAIDFLEAQGGGSLNYTEREYKIRGDILLLKSNVHHRGINYPEIYTDTVTPYAKMFGKRPSELLENVEIRGLVFDQWRKDLIPDRNGAFDAMCNILFFQGECKNVIVEDNVFKSIGVWNVCFHPHLSHVNINDIFIERNKIFWKIRGATWYDASAIYVESVNHVIRHNHIQSVRDANTPTDISWKITGGIETHGQGIVEYNKIVDAYAGINIVNFSHFNENKDKRVVANNILKGTAGNGIWLWSLGEFGGIENLDVYGNQIEMVKSEGEKTSGILRYGAMSGIGTQIAPITNGYLKNINIFNNSLTWLIDNYSGMEQHFNIYNTGGILVDCLGAFDNVNVYDNYIINCPYPAFTSTIFNNTNNKVSKNLNVRNNHLVDCGWGLTSAYEKCVFYIAHTDNVDIYDNKIEWINRKATEWLAVLNGTNTRFKNNQTISKNGFKVEAVLMTRSYLTATDIVTDVECMRYMRNDNPVIIPRISINSSRPAGNFYVGDVMLETNTNVVGIYRVDNAGTQTSISAVVERVDDNHLRWISGTKLKINDIISIGGTRYVINAEGMGANGNVYKTYQTLPNTITGQVTATNFTPALVKV